MSSHKVLRVLPYSSEQLFDIAADVERYSEFQPWWVATRVRDRHGDVYHTDQVVGLGPIRQRFSSRTVLRRPDRIEVTSSDRPFRRFELTWAFDPVPGEGCRVSLAADVELRSRLLQNLFGQSMARMVEGIAAAFEARAGRLYGPPPRTVLPP